MNPNAFHITVCLCTYRRPSLLKRLLLDLEKQSTESRFSFSLVVADNDPEQSAKYTVEEFRGKSQLSVVYVTEPRRSISNARNKSLEPSTGEYIAFIDDDEFPANNWLLNLFLAVQLHDCAGALGPVRPLYEDGTPEWIKKGGFFDRPEHETGHILHWTECRTGNVLFRRNIIEGISPVFLPQFGTCGSDADFFMRMTNRGHRFIWCNEAVVHEIVPPSRWKRSALLSRALLRGQTTANDQHYRFQGLAKAILAVPLYALALPFLAIIGHHHFMRYFVKLCDHLGRLFAAIGFHPIKERTM